MEEVCLIIATALDAEAGDPSLIGMSITIRQ